MTEISATAKELLSVDVNVVYPEVVSVEVMAEVSVLDRDRSDVLVSAIEIPAPSVLLKVKEDAIDSLTAT